MLRISGMALGALVAGLLATPAQVAMPAQVTMPAQAAVAEDTDARPSFVVITADDMRLDDLDWMRHTRTLLDQLELTEFISNHPMCCPSRASLLTGQLADKSGVFHNGGPFGAYHSLEEPDNTIASWLYDAGYRTGFVGKFVNGWIPGNGWTQPYGWTDFNAWMDKVYSAYGYTDWNNGEPVQPGLHTNDAVTAGTIAQIKEYGADPFFIWASYVAPHGMKDDTTGRYLKTGPVPAQRHRRLFSRVVPPYQKKKSFSYGRTKTREYRALWRNRVRSLKSVDEGVRDIVRALQETGAWDDTVVLFTSDNGFLLGEHRAHGKNLPWEESIRVPFLARGPGVATGSSSKQAMITDIAPSIAAMAGVTPGREVDGHTDLFSLDGGWDDLLIQAGSDDWDKHFRWRGQRTSRWTYVHWLDGRKELYDRRRDPLQLRNLAGKRPRVQQRLAALTPEPY